MTQSGTVVRLLDDRTAEVAVRRSGACGESCASCTVCVSPSLFVKAQNGARALPGDVVELESQTGQTLGLAALVYLLPVVLLLGGLLIGPIAGAAGFALGIAAALLGNRRVALRGGAAVTIRRVMERR